MGVTIAEFLEARIAEDEAAARGASTGPWFRDSGWSISAPPPEGWDGPYVVVETPRARNDAEFIARHDPARVLAECAAKRAIIGLHDGYSHSTEDGAVDAWCALNAVLKDLASIYSDHPDYEQQWAL